MLSVLLLTPAMPIIECETCRHFTGSTVLLSFGCAKSPDRHTTLTRKECNDFSKATRAELMVMRSKFISSAGAQFKSDATQVKRTLTSLANLTSENGLGRYLSARELDQAKAVQAALSSLVPDLKKAAKLAEARQTAERNRVELHNAERMRTAINKLAPGATPEELLGIFDELRVFTTTWRSPTALNTRGESAGAAVSLWDSDALVVAAKHYRAAPSSAALDAFVVALGEFLEQLNLADRADVAAGGLRDFLAFRKG